MTGETNQGGTNTETFEDRLTVYYDDLTDYVDRYMIPREAGVFIHQQLEEQFPDIKGFTDILTSYYQGSEADAEAQETAYNAFHFAYNMASRISRGLPTISFALFRELAETPEDMLARYEQQVEAFRIANPHVDLLIGRYMADIDTGGRYGHVAEMVALTGFMLIEDGDRMQAAEVAATAFASELEAWDGTISELL